MLQIIYRKCFLFHKWGEWFWDDDSLKGFKRVCHRCGEVSEAYPNG